MYQEITSQTQQLKAIQDKAYCYHRP
jgi:hypothetical protein